RRRDRVVWHRRLPGRNETLRFASSFRTANGHSTATLPAATGRLIPHGRRTPSIYLCHSTNVFLNHAQMNPKTVQIDFEWARNPEHLHGGFNLCESCLILAKPGSVGAVSEFAFKISQSPVQLVDAMKVEPPVKPRCETDDGNERRDNGNDKEYDSVEERGQPETTCSAARSSGRSGKMPLPLEKAANHWVARREIHRAG